MLDYEKIKNLLKSSLEHHWENDDEVDIAECWHYSAIYPTEEADEIIQSLQELGCSCYCEDDLHNNDNDGKELWHILIPLPK